MTERTDTIQITVWVQTDKVGSDCESTVEFPREDWESMTDDERAEELQETMWNMCEWGWRHD